MSSSGLLGLPQANLELVRDYKVQSDHRRLWQAVINGLVPGVWVRGRWYVDRRDLPDVAEALQVMAPASSGRPRTAVSA